MPSTTSEKEQALERATVSNRYGPDGSRNDAGYRKAGGLAGAELVPDLATSIPQPADGGRTYTFRMRDGIRYSNGVLVQPEDIRHGIERTMRSRNPYLTGQYTGILGAGRCRPRA